MAIDVESVGEALSISVQAGVPVLLWGSPGTGKTSVVRALGESLGWPTEVVIGSIREPADFAGLPVVINGAVQMAPPLWARRLAEGGHGLLFLDELTTAPPAVQAAMLRVVLERVVGDLALPEGVRIVAAANPPEASPPSKRPPCEPYATIRSDAGMFDALVVLRPSSRGTS